MAKEHPGQNCSSEENLGADSTGAIIKEMSLRSRQEGEDFAEIVRHRLNTPLTGILGNTEFVIAELRKRMGGTLPPSIERRLNTIVELCTFFREEIRDLCMEIRKEQK